MSAATITAVLEATAALIGAITALVAALRGSQQLKSHVLSCRGAISTPATSPQQKETTSG